MKQLITIILTLLLTSSAFAQLELDKAGRQLLDSLKIKYDPNDPDATLKLEQQLKDKFMAKYDSAMKEAGNIVIDPNNTEGLIAEIRDELSDGDTTSTDFEFMQVLPILQINLDHPDRRFLNESGFDLPNNIDLLLITGNGKSIPVDLNALLTKLSSRDINQLYLTRDKDGISEIPIEIGNLRTLRVLGMYGNNIAQLPASIGDLTQLEELYIDVNPIQKLPETIGSLKKLKKLGIAKTQIDAQEQARIQKLLPNCQILLK
jgi:Leucine-rich repeat (LRR) protein